MFFKLSTTFFLLRIFGLGSKRCWRWNLYLVTVTTILTQRPPLAKLWSPHVRGHCWAQTKYLYGGGEPLTLLIIRNETLGL